MIGAHLVNDNGKLSGSKTLLSLFCLTAILRYAFDGVTLQLGCDAGACAINYAVAFKGAEAAAFLTPLAALNWGRRHTDANIKPAA